MCFFYNFQILRFKEIKDNMQKFSPISVLNESKVLEIKKKLGLSHNLQKTLIEG